MNKLSKCMIWAVLIPALLSVVSCTDDRLFEEQDAPNGVDRDKMVEVTIPFSMGKGIQTNITTRSTADTDSQLSGIMVFVYENDSNKPASEKKRVAWQLFSNPAAGNLEHSNGGWIPDGDDPTCGKIKFHVPVGDCYIYLIGNASGTFLEFFPGIGTPGGNGEDPLATLQGFWNEGTPKWTENMDIVDGYLPLVGTVNNERGDCHVDENGNITFTDKDGNEHTISPNSTDESDDNNSFVLKRLMSKVTVNIESPKGVTFTPKDYRFRHVATYVSPIDAAWTDEQKDRIPVTDTEVVPFSAQSPNSFTVYLPENVRTAAKEIKDFAGREAIVKDSSGKNTLETEEGHDEHYLFQNAPKNSTYMEITGRFEGQNEDGTTLSADCRYFIHLGDFGEGDKGYQDFSLRRDHHYTYNINVKGVNAIEVEVDDGTEAPGAEGIVFEGGARVQLDAHYEQVEMHLKKEDIEKGVYIYAQTPFGMVNCKYLPEKKELDSSHANTPESLEQIQKLLQWVEFKKQSGIGTLATYKTGTTKNVFETLNEVYESTDGAYYTCFVDEYYYTSDPLNDKRSIHLSDFVNVEDRTFSLGSQLQYSTDGKSAVSRAVYVLQQHSIATFYDLDNHEVAKYGVETIDEIGELVGKMTYGDPQSEGTDPKDGRTNTLNEIKENNSNTVVNWAQNGFLLSKDEKTLEAGEQRLNTKAAYLACLTRNRDFTGDGMIDETELRWYTPARDQVLGLWIGEPALPVKAALYPNSTTELDDDPNTCQWPVFTSTGGDNRVIWAEQGASFGSEGSAGEGGGYVRVVRNLGDRPSPNSYTTDAEPYYHYSGVPNRTIEVYLTSNALRAFSSRELAPHHERSVINRPYKKFQVANHPYVKENVKVTCNEDGLTYDPETKYYTQLQATNENKAKTDVTTIASQYTGDEPDISNATWRLPNQREIALMIVAMGTDLDYTKEVNGDAEYYNRWKYVCEGHTWTHAWHDWKYSKTSILHCRTSFSKEGYSTGYLGYMYNTEGKKMQMMYNTGGAGATGIAGYLCVRDVPN